jgi:PAS domain S-box-containing protein
MATIDIRLMSLALLIIGGSIIQLMALRRINRIIVDFPVKRRQWKFLRGFVAFFFAGYVVFAVALWLHKTFTIEAAITSMVFFLGACFVFIIMRMSYDSMEALEKSTSLHKSEERFRIIFEDGPVGMATITPDYRISKPNKALCAMLGYTEQELLGKSLEDITYSGDREKSRKLAMSLLKGDLPMYRLEKRYIKKNGEIAWTHLTAATVHSREGQVLYGLAIIEDITERKEAEDELKLFRNLLDKANDSIFVIDPETACFLDVNAKSCSNLGYSREELLKMCVPDIETRIPDMSSWRARVIEVKNKGHAVREGRQKRKDGTTFPIEVSANYISFEKRDYFVAVVRDITERKEAEEVLQRSEKQYKDLFDSTLDGVYQVDADGVFILMNPAGARIFGYETPEEMIGRNALEYWRDPKDRDVFRAELKVKKRVTTYHMKAKKKTGESIELESSSRIIEDEKGDFLGVEGILRDVTERKQAEERISRQIHKLSSLRSIDLTISASLDLRVTLKVFIDHVVTQLSVDATNVLLLNPHTGMLEYAASQGFRTSALRHSHLRLGEGYAGVAALENRIVSIPNLRAEERGFKRSEFFEGEDFITYYAVPLVAKGHVKGVLEIFHRNSLEPDEEWFEFLDALALQAAIAIDNNSLFYDLERSNVDLVLAYDRTIEGWSRALDYKDKETEGHSQRVTEMTLRIAREMGMNEEELVHVRRGALLHDIGKMGIPDSILLKPGTLTEEEWKIMRLHPVYSYELLNPIAYLRPALDIPYCHHEKWDGTGYPRGLKGEEIHLSARIFAVVDVWDALSSERPYRRAWSEEKTKEYIRSLSGIQFDPMVIDVFFKIPL